MFGEDRLWSRYLKRGAVCIAILISFFPIFWLVSTSFKPIEEWQKFPPVWISSQPTLQNYRIVFAPKAAQEFAAKQSGAISYKVSGSAWKAFGDSAKSHRDRSDDIICPVRTLAAYSIVRFDTGATITLFNFLRYGCFRRLPSSCRWLSCFYVAPVRYLRWSHARLHCVYAILQHMDHSKLH